MAPIDKPFIIHIGRHKSGTSALQKALQRNYDVLRDQGFLYPRDCRSEPAHHRISSHFLPAGRRHFTLEETRRAVRRLRREAAPFDGTVVLSSEGFQNCAPADLTRLFPASKTHVVVYLREQFAYAQSAYAQAVQGGKYSKTFDDYLTEFRANYVNFLAKWKNTFAPQQLTVRLYDRTALLNGDVVDDFLSICGIEADGFDPITSDPNVSIGGPLLEVKRAVNALRIPRQDLVEAQAYTILARVARSDGRFRTKPTAAPDVVNRFRARFQESNKQLSEKYFSGEDTFSYSDPAPTENVTTQDIENVLLAIEAHGGQPLLDLVRQIPEPWPEDRTLAAIWSYIR